MNKTHSCKLLCFQTTDEGTYNDKDFVIHAFGINEKRHIYAIRIENYRPFIYIKVTANNLVWSDDNLNLFRNLVIEHLIDRDVTIDESAFHKLSFHKYKTLYGFDCDKKYDFIKMEFKNNNTYNAVKKAWYVNTRSFRNKTLLRSSITKEPGISFIIDEPDAIIHTQLYEGNIPPLLRAFHINSISPSGWISFKGSEVPNQAFSKKIKYFHLKFSEITPMPDKEDTVPYKICSFDIEALSSHGDFPQAVKFYKKLANDIVLFWKKNNVKTKDKHDLPNVFKNLFEYAFGFKIAKQSSKYNAIHKIYLKDPKTVQRKPDILIANILKFFQIPLLELLQKSSRYQEYINELKYDDYNAYIDLLKDWHPTLPKNLHGKATAYDLLNSSLNNVDKTHILSRCMDFSYFKDKWGRNYNTKNIPNKTQPFPAVDGDKVSMIGSTFLNYGEELPYLNNCIVLKGCEPYDLLDLESVPTEKQLLLRWRDLIQKEDPDIIIGYNIFGFDWDYLIQRSEECECHRQFIQLSRFVGKECKVIKSTTKVASGTHKLTYLQIPGRVQIDLYNHFRKEFNLSSYKLDSVGSQFIGDNIHKYVTIDGRTKFTCKNIMGLQNDNFITFEIISHSNDPFNDGHKYVVKNVNIEEHSFYINEVIDFNTHLNIRWGLAKDDVTFQDIFKLSIGTNADRTIVAKYCIQDCNLVQHLLRKLDIITGFVELANLCNVPIDYIILRGQGIKLLSFIAKKCREDNILMPVVEPKLTDGSYEGAVCLPPKCGLYLDNPIACNDYSSLYPSSMISENISHDTKVWTKEFDLNGSLIKVNGSDIYDNLKDYTYVDITYDTFQWLSTQEGKKEQKIKTGFKICRYAQPNSGKKGIMPSVLIELLTERKRVRAYIKYKTVKTLTAEFSGIIQNTADTIIIQRNDFTTVTVNNADVLSIHDTYDDFMKNVFDKRQLSCKITANSLYGQCGGKTSTFYDKDIAASTTAIGRKLLFYAKHVVETTYKNTVCNTNHGLVRTNAEYIYGDSVTGDTPLLLKNKITNEIEFKQIDDLSNNWEKYDGFKVNESNRREKQQANVNDYYIWSSNGWSNIKRVIRHKTIKKIYRVTTHTGMVDVTEDHSLLDDKGNKLKPKDAKIGMKLLHNYPKFDKREIKLKDIMNYIKNIGSKSLCEKKAFILGFFYGDDSCGKYESKWGKKYSWAINQKDIKMCLILQSLLIEIYNESFKIDDTIKSSGVYKIRPNCENIKKYVEMYRSICYNKDKYKIIPVDILNSKYDIRYAYFTGYYAADGSKCPTGPTKNIRFSNKGKIGSAMLYYLASSIGLNVSINTRKDKLNITRLSCTSGKQRKAENVIKNIDLIGENIDNFVYDIETETGNFNTGFPLIVKNTDSVFFTFNLKDMTGQKITGKKALEITIELAQQAETLATAQLKPPHKLEYEKTLMPFLLLSKKRYVGMLYEHNPNKCYRKDMGIVLKRRDNAPIVKDIYGGIIERLMNADSVDSVIEYTKGFLQNIINGQFPLEKLIITKKLNAEYKNPDSIAHKVLADRMGKRDSGNKPAIGSRIPFCFILTDSKSKLQGDKIEHPDYIRIHQIKPDFQYYITNQIMKPVMQVFGLLLEQISSFRTQLPRFKKQLLQIKNINHDLESYRVEREKITNKYIKELVFGESLKICSRRKMKNNGIHKFITYS